MTWVTRTALATGLAFLYAPILVLIAYSFTASPLVTVWGGFSGRWYAALLADAPMLAAAWVSLKVAVLASLIATTLGTLAALALERHGRFRGRALFTGLVFGPIVMPEVMIGLSLLLMFIGIGLDRGLLTIVIAHATFCTGFVTVVVAARLRGLDRSLEEAAADLGATPVRVLASVTLPLLDPAGGGRPRGGGARCSPSRCRSTSSSSRASSRGPARPRCRCDSTARSASGLIPRSTPPRRSSSGS